MKVIYSLLLFISLTFHLPGQSWVNYTTNNTIHDIKKHEDQLWVGTDGGLVRIDLQTNEKEIFQTWNSGLTGAGVFEIAIASDGTKWMIGSEKSIFKYDDNNWEAYYSPIGGEPFRAISNLKIDYNGNPWFITYSTDPMCTYCSTIYAFDGTSFVEKIYTPITNLNPTPNDYEFIDEDRLWVSTTSELLLCEGDQIIETYNSTNCILEAEEQIIKTLVDSQGNLILISRLSTNDRRILKFDGTDWSIEVESIPNFRNVFKDNDNNIWINVYDPIASQLSYRSYDGFEWSEWSNAEVPDIGDSGFGPTLLCADQDTWWVKTYTGPFEPRVYKIENQNIVTSVDTEMQPLITNWADNIVADCNNNVWLLTHYLTKISGKNWENFSPTVTGVMGTFIDAVVDPTNCDIWFGVYSDPFNDDTDTDIIKYNGDSFEAFGLESGSVRAIDMDSNGVLYVASSEMGLGIFMDGNWTFFDASNSPLTNTLSQVQVRGDGTIWVVTTDDEIVVKDGEDWIVFNNSNSPIDDYSFLLFLDADDNIWTNKTNGLAKYNDNGTWEVFNLDLPYEIILSMAEDHQGNFWLGCYDGTWYWNGFDYVNYNIYNSSLGSNVVRKIHVDPYNRDVWMLSQSGGVTVLSDHQVQKSINGTAFFDSNLDGVFDPLEDARISDQPILFLPDTTIAFTNSIGAYSFYPNAEGPFQITYTPESPFQLTTPATIDSVCNGETINDLNFGVWSEDVVPEMSIDITTSQIVCNIHANIWITFKNLGYLPTSGEIKLNFDSGFNFISSMPDAIQADSNQVTWLFEDLSFMQSRTYQLQLESPDVIELGQEFIFTAEIIESNQNTLASTTETLLCSYDPNDKSATPLGESVTNYSLLDDPFQYTIRFQNMGNYRATDITIRDTIDAVLDLSTFKVISSSHEMTTTINNATRELVFRFDNINLTYEEDDFIASQGFVKYEITPLANLPDPTFVENTAYIIFDFNPAIVTNTTENILVETLPTINTLDIENSFKVTVQPNPFTNQTLLRFQNDTNEMHRLELTDMSGKQVRLIENIDGTEVMIARNNLPQGIYMYRLTGEERIATGKLVVQ